MAAGAGRSQLGRIRLPPDVAPDRRRARFYAAYGGVYVAVAIAWLWAVDKVQPTVTDWVGVSVCLLGMAIIMVGTRQSS